MKRLRRIFAADGKTVIVAMDHGTALPVNPALDKTGEILEAVVRGGADAVLVSYGIAKKFADILGDIGVIVRADGGYSSLCNASSGGYPRLLHSVQDALRVGADAVACNGFPGTPGEADCMKNVSELARQGCEWNVPLMAEMLPGGFGPEVPNTPENVRLAVRMGCEYGANIIKTTFAGTTEQFRQVVEASYQPVVVLGGEAVSDLDSLFACIEQSMIAGARGVAIGRNVWKHPNPEAVTRALVDLVHGGAKASSIKGL